MNECTRLNQRHPEAAFSSGKGGLRRMELRGEHGSAEIYLHGAHLTAFRPGGADPVLWMSEKSEFEVGKPIRGGVPICFPWFGRHPSDPSQPAHGFVRLREWQVESVSRLPDGSVRASLRFESDTETLQIWPHSFSLLFTVTVSRSLTMQLEARNTGTQAFTMSEALHTYYAVSDIRTVDLYGLEDAEYLDKVLESDSPRTQRGPIRFTAETDRPYLDTAAPCVIEDAGLNRSVRIEKRGSYTTVVWNPWVSKARRMEDFGDDEWKQMLCVETANALRNAITVPAGASHLMETVISIEKTE